MNTYPEFENVGLNFRLTGRLNERRGSVSIGLERWKLTHRTPHSPTLITAGVKDGEVFFDIFIGGKFKGIECGVEWHYGSARAEAQLKTRQPLKAEGSVTPKCHGRLHNHNFSQC